MKVLPNFNLEELFALSLTGYGKATSLFMMPFKNPTNEHFCGIAFRECF